MCTITLLMNPRTECWDNVAPGEQWEVAVKNLTFRINEALMWCVEQSGPGRWGVMLWFGQVREDSRLWGWFCAGDNSDTEEGSFEESRMSRWVLRWRGAYEESLLFLPQPLTRDQGQWGDGVELTRALGLVCSRDQDLEAVRCTATCSRDETAWRGKKKKKHQICLLRCCHIVLNQK